MVYTVTSSLILLLLFLSATLHESVPEDIYLIRWPYIANKYPVNSNWLLKETQCRINGSNIIAFSESQSCVVNTNLHIEARSISRIIIYLHTLCDKVCQWIATGRCLFRFPLPINSRPRYNWNIVESGVKHYNTINQWYIYMNHKVHEILIL